MIYLNAEMFLLVLWYVVSRVGFRLVGRQHVVAEMHLERDHLAHFQKGKEGKGLH